MCRDGAVATRQEMIDALKAIGGSSIERRGVVFQPHVREATRKSGAGPVMSPDPASWTLFVTDAACRALGAELIVLNST